MKLEHKQLERAASVGEVGFEEARLTIKDYVMHLRRGARIHAEKSAELSKQLFEAQVQLQEFRNQHADHHTIETNSHTSTTIAIGGSRILGSSRRASSFLGPDTSVAAMADRDRDGFERWMDDDRGPEHRLHDEFLQ